MATHWDERTSRYVSIWEEIPGTAFFIYEVESEDEDGNEQSEFIICWDKDLKELDD